jgi:uncharacterized membrane protein
MKSPQEFNSRGYQRRLERELVIGGIVVGALVGVGLIYLIWGTNAAITSIGCFVLMILLIGVVWGFLTIIGRLSESK